MDAVFGVDAGALSSCEIAIVAAGPLGVGDDPAKFLAPRDRAAA